MRITVDHRAVPASERRMAQRAPLLHRSASTSQLTQSASSARARLRTGAYRASAAAPDRTLLVESGRDPLVSRRVSFAVKPLGAAIARQSRRAP